MRIQDLVELAEQNGVVVPWNFQCREEDVVRFLRERNIFIPEESVLSREELRRRARSLKIPKRSLLRTKGALERAIEKAKARERPVRLQSRRSVLSRIEEESAAQQPVPILDREVPNIPVQVLRPETVSVSPHEAPGILQRTVSSFANWMGWISSASESLTKAVSLSLERLKNEISRLWEEKVEIEEGPSAFRRFLREYRIYGPAGDPRSFIRKITQEVLKILGREKNTKVKFILRCEIRCRNRNGNRRGSCLSFSS